MRVIERIIIEDFQCHERFEIDLDPRITVLTGPSDSGKTAVLRALSWLVFNRPQGDAFVRRGSAGCSVDLEIDGQTVGRIRGDGSNLYRHERQDYKAFGREVPPDVQRLLNLGEVNFASQHEPAFWFSKSPGEVSRELNGIINLSLIDSTLANITQEVRKAKGEVEYTGQRFKDSEQRRDSLKWTVKADKELREIESRDQEMGEITHRIAQARRSLQEMETLQSEGDRLTEAVTEGKKVIALAGEVTRMEGEIDRVKAILDEITRTEEEICRLREHAKSLQKDLAVKTEGMCPLCGQSLTSSPCSSPTSICATSGR